MLALVASLVLSGPVVDSRTDLSHALAGSRCPVAIRKTLTLADVTYYGFDGRLHAGQVVVRRDLEANLNAVFGDLRKAKFPIRKVIPISVYGWDDLASQRDDNTSVFNYRRVLHSRRLSKHAEGRAIDLNPRENPDMAQPVAEYRSDAKGTVTSSVVKIFRAHGWRWGGSWRGKKDYQHFDHR